MGGDDGATEQGAPEEWFKDWFEQPADLPFVVHLRRLSAVRLVGLVEPGATGHIQPGSEMNFGGSLLLVNVIDDVTYRELTPRSSWILQLQVLWNGNALQGYWGDAYYWDGFHPDCDGVLDVHDPSMTDAAAAERTVEWLHEQLSRPLELRRWDRPEGRPAFEMRLTDTGARVSDQGWPWHRRGDPISVTQVRPPASRPA